MYFGDRHPFGIRRFDHLAQRCVLSCSMFQGCRCKVSSYLLYEENGWKEEMMIFIGAWQRAKLNFGAVNHLKYIALHWMMQKKSRSSDQVRLESGVLVMQILSVLKSCKPDASEFVWSKWPVAFDSTADLCQCNGRLQWSNYIHIVSLTRQNSPILRHCGHSIIALEPFCAIKNGETERRPKTTMLSNFWQAAALICWVVSRCEIDSSCQTARSQHNTFDICTAAVAYPFQADEKRAALVGRHLNIPA